MYKLSVPIFALVIVVIFLGISGCAATSMFKEGAHSIDRSAAGAGFEEKYVTFENFSLKTYRKFQSPKDNLCIYIEGDGNAWKRKSILSNDPTPSNPVALKLALIDPAKNIIYIARPGQFPKKNSPKCDPTYWSARRFSPEVIEAVNKVIDIAKKDSGAENIEIVGYSGGGAIAVLVAERRSDVTALRTVAGNLDIKGFSAYHHVSPLNGSLNPIDYSKNVRHIPQKHFIGSRDKIIPNFIAESFADKIGDSAHKSIYVVAGATHNSKWQDLWKEILLEPLYNSGIKP